LKREKEVREHVKKQVRKILMDQATGNNGVNTLAFGNAVWVQNKFTVQLFAVKSKYAKYKGNGKNGAGYRRNRNVG